MNSRRIPRTALVVALTTFVTLPASAQAPAIPQGAPPAAGGGPAKRPGAPGAAATEPAAADPAAQAGSVPPGFRTQVRAALDFIAATRKRDPEALAEATALRAPHDPEVSAKHQKLFQAILDKELPDAELDALATQFEGFQVKDVIIGKSTGRANIIFSKRLRDDMLEKTIVVRKEKAGWKVTNFSGDRSYVGRRNAKANR